MNERIQTPVKPAAKSPTFAPARSGLSQRKQCACGGTPSVDGQCAECRAKRLSSLQPSPQQGPGGRTILPEAPAVVHEVLNSPGQPLEATTRVFMEPRFGHDFSHVRLHTDAKAAQSAREVSANAYTAGRNIVFANGQYAPHTADGRKLIAHELTHVIQQGNETSLPASVPLPIDTSGEAAAEEASEQVMSGQSAGHVGSGYATSIQRQLPRLMPPSPPTAPPAPWVIPQTLPVPPVYPVPNQKPQPENQPKGGPCGSPDLPYTLVSFFPGPLGQGGRVKASPLTLCPGNTIGSKPQDRIYADQFRCIDAAGETGNWVRGHILHGKTDRSGDRNLHGPGDTAANLIIIDQSLNQSMRSWIENAVLKLVYGPLPHVLWLDAWVDSYHPGLPFFADSISVEYGPFDTGSGREGPRWNFKQFVLGRKPPNCPATGFAEGIFPGSARRSRSGFQSTLQICHRELETRHFEVAYGGLMVAINARWVGRGPGEEAARAEGQPGGCPRQDYHVALYRDNSLAFDDQISWSELSSGQRELRSWRGLDDGVYYLEISTENRDPYCCLEGDITVDTFPAPGPKSRREAEVV